VWPSSAPWSHILDTYHTDLGRLLGLGGLAGVLFVFFFLFVFFVFFLLLLVTVFPLRSWGGERVGGGVLR